MNMAAMRLSMHNEVCDILLWGGSISFFELSIIFVPKGMLGITFLKESAKKDKPLKDAKIVGCTHINAQTAVSFIFFF